MRKTQLTLLFILIALIASFSGAATYHVKQRTLTILHSDCSWQDIMGRIHSSGGDKARVVLDDAPDVIYVNGNPVAYH